MSTDATQARPWTGEMVMVHRVFRRELAMLAQQIPLVPKGDTARVTLLADHCAFALDMLHVHHHGEDLLLWPKLKDRAAMQADLVARMEAEHEHVSELIDATGPRLAAWRAKPGPDTAEPLAAGITELRTALVQHLDEEEAEILPLVSETITPAEWGELGKHGIGSTPPPKRLFVLGLILEEATPEEEKRFLAQVPAVPRTIYKVVGRRQYANKIARLRGTAA